MARPNPVSDACAKAAVRTESSLVGWRVERLRAAIDGPLAVVAAGHTFAAAVLWARLHEAQGHPAWALTPYELRERALPTDARVLVMSVSGRHHDVLSAARAVAERRPTIAVTCDRSAPLVRVVRGAQDASDAIILPAAQRPARSVPMAVLAARVYGGMGAWMAAFRDARPAPAPPDPPRAVVCLGAGLGRAAATDFAARCLDTGFAPARTVDVRNFADAETAAYDPARDWLLAVATGAAQRTYIDRLVKLLPEGAHTVRLESDREGVTGALDVFAQSIITFAALDVPPSDVPDWATRLGRLAV